MEDHRFIELIVFVAFFSIGLPYLIGPLLAWFVGSQSAHPRLEPFATGVSHLPRSVQAHFRESSQSMRELGFEVLGGYFLPNQSPAVKCLVMMFANRRTKELSISAAIYSQPTGVTQVRIGGSHVEFVSRFADDFLVQTNNIGQLTAFPKADDVVTARFPKVRDVARLYRLHQAVVERTKGSSPRVLRVDEEFDGDAEEYLSAVLVEELNDQVGTGYMYLSSDGKHFRPTLKGAALMTWGQLFPVKQFRVARRERLARRWILEIEESSNA